MPTDVVALSSPPLPSAAPAAPAVPVPATLTKRASLNAVQSLLDYAARLGVGLIVTPLLVSRLGRDLFGVWEMLNRLIGYMSAADGRPTEALRLVIATKQAASDPMEHRRAVGSALGVWLLFSPLLAGLGSVLVWLSPVVTKVPPALYTTVRVASAALLVSLLLGASPRCPRRVRAACTSGTSGWGFKRDSTR